MYRLEITFVLALYVSILNLVFSRPQMWVYENAKMAKRPTPQTDYNQNAMNSSNFLPQYVVTPYVVSSTPSSVATQPSSVDYVNSLPMMQGMTAAVAPPSESQAIRASYGAAQLRKYT